MEIKCSDKRRQNGHILLGIVVLITLVFIGIIFYTIASRCRKFKPRDLTEDTNLVAHIQVDWLRPGFPIVQDPPPMGAAAQTMNSFTNELIFPWYPEMDGWLYIWRTPDYYNYTLLYYVLFEEEDRFITNSSGDIFIVVKFVDQFALDGHAFYDGEIKLNTP